MDAQCGNQCLQSALRSLLTLARRFSLNCTTYASRTSIDFQNAWPVLYPALVTGCGLLDSSTLCQVPSRHCPVLTWHLLPFFLQVKMLRDGAAHPAKLSLIQSSLRSPHACHRAYMRNMGTASSLTFAIMIPENSAAPPTQAKAKGDKNDRNPAAALGLGRLWGLVVCHHSGPRFPSYPMRSATHLFVQVRMLAVVTKAW